MSRMTPESDGHSRHDILGPVGQYRPKVATLENCMRHVMLAFALALIVVAAIFTMRQPIELGSDNSIDAERAEVTLSPLSERDRTSQDSNTDPAADGASGELSDIVAGQPVSPVTEQGSIVPAQRPFVFPPFPSGNRSIVAIDEAFRNEPVDSDWAAEKEGRILKGLTDFSHGFAGLYVECRSTICRIQAVSPYQNVEGQGTMIRRYIYDFNQWRSSLDDEDLSEGIVTHLEDGRYTVQWLYRRGAVELPPPETVDDLPEWVQRLQ